MCTVIGEIIEAVIAALGVAGLGAEEASLVAACLGDPEDAAWLGGIGAIFGGASAIGGGVSTLAGLGAEAAATGAETAVNFATGAVEEALPSLKQLGAMFQISSGMGQLLTLAAPNNEALSWFNLLTGM